VLKQIILMPQTDYWSWVRACKEFVMTFRASMTRDPETAVRHMAPRQVVTVVSAGDAYPEYGDILSWLKQRNPDLRLDIITAMTPGELKMVLDRPNSRLSHSHLDRTRRSMEPMAFRAMREWTSGL
jgi:hypothetical protein